MCPIIVYRFRILRIWNYRDCASYHRISILFRTSHIGTTVTSTINPTQIARNAGVVEPVSQEAGDNTRQKHRRERDRQPLPRHPSPTNIDSTRRRKLLLSSAIG